MMPRALYATASVLVLLLTTYAVAHAQKRNEIGDRFASVNGVRLHYLIAGKGEPVILLHG